VDGNKCLQTLLWEEMKYQLNEQCFETTSFIVTETQRVNEAVRTRDALRAFFERVRLIL